MAPRGANLTWDQVKRSTLHRPAPPDRIRAMAAEEQNAFLIGQIALEMKLLKPEDLQACLTLQAAKADRRSLGKYLVSAGYLDPPQLERVLEEQRRCLEAKAAFSEDSQEFALFGKILAREGRVSADPVHDALAAQSDMRERGIGKRLGELLFEAGHVSADDVRNALERQGKRIMACVSCDVRFNVLSWLSNGYPCRRCGAALVPAVEALDASETCFLTPVRTSSPSTSTSRAVAPPPAPVVPERRTAPAPARPLLKAALTILAVAAFLLILMLFMGTSAS